MHCRDWLWNRANLGKALFDTPEAGSIHVDLEDIRREAAIKVSQIRESIQSEELITNPTSFDKIERCRKRNRENARFTRLRRKMYVELLKLKVVELRNEKEIEILKLSTLNDTLCKRNFARMSKLSQFVELMSHQSDNKYDWSEYLVPSAIFNVPCLPSYSSVSSESTMLPSSISSFVNIPCAVSRNQWGIDNLLGSHDMFLTASSANLLEHNTNTMTLNGLDDIITGCRYLYDEVSYRAFLAVHCEGSTSWNRSLCFRDNLQGFSNFPDFSNCRVSFHIPINDNLDSNVSQIAGEYVMCRFEVLMESSSDFLSTCYCSLGSISDPRCVNACSLSSYHQIGSCHPYLNDNNMVRAESMTQELSSFDFVSSAHKSTMVSQAVKQRLFEGMLRCRFNDCDKIMGLDVFYGHCF